MQFVATTCAICGTFDQADTVWDARLPAAALTPARYSARRDPDRVHARVVRCRTCGLLRSDPAPPPELTNTLYQKSEFSYGENVAMLRRNYGRLLRELEQRSSQRGALLDIGCGNGFLLEEAIEHGWREVAGLEPSRDARDAAATHVRDAIVGDVLRPGVFRPGTFDAVTMFQVLDHLQDPIEALRECRNVLRPGGLVLAVNHNAKALSARLLGERSPIVDIEHTYLYDGRTMKRLFETAGFDVLRVRPVINSYPLGYLARLAPLPAAVKARTRVLLDWTRAGRVRVPLPLGNLALVGRRT